MKFETLWIFSNPKPGKIPSYVVSGIMPADYLGIQKVIFLKNHNPKIILKNYKPKLIIIGKAFHTDILYLLQEAKKLKVKIISVFDDWNFIEDTNNGFTKNELYKSIARLSDKIVVKTLTAANLINNKIGLDAKIIPDCLRYKSSKCIKNINYPFMASWFGMAVNHDTLLYGLKEIINFDYKISINIITNHIDNLKKELSTYNLYKVSLKFTEWSPVMEKEIIKSDVVIVPYIKDELRIVKSQNRVVDSLNMGRFVIASKMPFLDELESFCFLGNIGEGFQWIKENNDLAIKKTKKGKKYAKENFGIKNIASQWKKLIEETL